MKITRTQSACLTTIGDVMYGDIVLFHSPPSAVSYRNSFYKNTAQLQEPYILADFGRGDSAFLLRCYDGYPLRASYADKVEVLEDAELQL